MPFSLQPVDWIAAGIVIAFLIPIVIIDWYRFLIPNVLVLPGIFMVIAWFATTDVDGLLSGLTHGTLAFSIILILWYFSKKQIGLGDAKLSFLIAAGLGFFEWWAVLLVASVCASVVGLVRIKAGKMTMKDKLPLAPFFGLGTAAVIVLKALFWNDLAAWF